MDELNYDMLLWDILKQHHGHHVYVALYGDVDDPVSVTLECEDCGSIVLDGGIYTICAREDV